MAAVVEQVSNLLVSLPLFWGRVGVRAVDSTPGNVYWDV
jgi:hypothetical protein